MTTTLVTGELDSPGIDASPDRAVSAKAVRACPSCVNKIEKQVGRLTGVASVKVHFASSRVEVAHDPATVSPDQLVAAVKKAGYKATPAAF